MFQSLDTPPNSVDGFLWADFVELQAVVKADKCFSRGDLSGVSKRLQDRGERIDFEERWHLAADFIGTRVKEFGESYPFSISENRKFVSLNPDVSPLKRLYLYLLVSSCMRHIVNKEKSKVARNFEETCLHVFSKLMPSGSEIRATWAGGGRQAHYKGTLFKKMKAIAKDIRCYANFKESDFKKNDTGDGGIDLVAWHPMADLREGIPIAFAQCGCSRDDWRFKQLEASPSRHQWHFPVMHLWATYYFLPLDLRQIDGDWAYKSDISGAIIVDRLRIVRLAKKHNLANHMKKIPILDNIIEKQ